jgi:hypothetical protein
MTRLKRGTNNMEWREYYSHKSDVYLYTKFIPPIWVRGHMQPLTTLLIMSSNITLNWLSHYLDLRFKFHVHWNVIIHQIYIIDDLLQAKL